MRTLLTLVLAAAIGCGGDDTSPASHNDAGDDSSTSASGTGGGGGRNSSMKDGGAPMAGQPAAGRPADNVKRELPQVYPLVRASTPTGLIADTMFMAEAYMIQPARDGGVGVLPQALGGAINLAVAIKERFYSMGPTEVLRIVRDLDGRLAGLDTDPSKHKCLMTTPIERTYTFPSGQSFGVKLQCMQSFGNPGDAGAGWVAFGFGPSDPDEDADAGTGDADGGTDVAGREAFYLVEGQEGGMGGAYRVAGDNVEAWIAVADSNAPSNSQVLMHLITHKTPAASELVLAGAGVGFCSGHMKTSADYLFIEGKTNGALPPGAPMTPGAQYCDASRAGCFAVGALETELSPDDAHCEPIAHPTFEIRGALDASNDSGANVMPGHIYTYFNQRPTGIAAF